MTFNQLYDTVVTKGGVPTKAQRQAFYETLDQAHRELASQREALNRTVFRSQHNRCGKTVLYALQEHDFNPKGRRFLAHVESKRVAARLTSVGDFHQRIQQVENALAGRDKADAK